MKYNSNDVYIVDEIIHVSVIYKKSLSIKLNKLCDMRVLRMVHENDSYVAKLTEENIVIILDAIKSYKFNISDDLQQYYAIIKSWDKDTIINQLCINDNVRNYIESESNTALTALIESDRSTRYQYTSNVLHDATLTGMIANRTNARIWIDDAIHSIGDIVTSLIELRRLPILFIFDTRHPCHMLLANLQQLAIAFGENNINNIGIYVTLPRSEIGDEFNNLIVNNQYDKSLSSATEVAGITHDKLPTFFLMNDWVPMSVVSFAKLRHSTSAIYASQCDLVITYSDCEQLISPTIY